MKKVTILLAEDEPALGQIIKDSLETRNFNVLLCADGEIALKACREKEPKIVGFRCDDAKKRTVLLWQKKLEKKIMKFLYYF